MKYRGLWVCGLIFAAQFGWGQKYTMTDLGTLGGTWSEAYAINGKGDVAGVSALANGERHAFLWTPAGGMQDLGVKLGSEGSWAQGINDSDEVAGFAASQHGTSALLWMKDGEVRNLGSLGTPGASAYAINSNGAVVDDADTPSYWSHAFQWTQSGGMQDLGTLGGSTSCASAINDAGLVTGYSAGPNGSDAFLWTESDGMQDLGQLGGSQSAGSGINNKGEVVGWTDTASGGSVAFLWTASAGMTSLGTLGGSKISAAVSINDSDVVVGYSELSLDGVENGFVWTKSAGMQNISDLIEDGSGWRQIFPAQINAKGSIAGTGTLANGQTHAVLFTPIK